MQHWLNRSTISFHSSILVLFCIFLTISSCSSESPEQTIHRLKKEAEQYFSDKQYNQAIDTWKNLLTLQPEAKDIYQKLAKSYQQCGQYRQAVVAFKEHLSSAPDSLDTAINLIKIQIQLFDIAGASATWKNLKSLANHPEILSMHGDLLAAQGQFLLAGEEYKKALDLDPTNQNALARLAVILVGQHEQEEAKTIYHKLEALSPDSSDILLQMSSYWILQGELEKGELFLKEVIKRIPGDQNLKIKLAEFYRETRQYTNAATLFHELLENSPNNRYYKKMLLENLLLSSQSAQSEAFFEGLSAAESQDIDFTLLKGKYYLNTGKYGLASSQFEQVLEKEPDHSLAYYYLALSYFANGQNNLGKSFLIKCLSLNPYFTAAEMTLADFYYKSGEYELTLEHITQIQEREPENYHAILLQGATLLAINNFEEALEALGKAFILNSDDPAPQFYLSVLFSLMEKPEKALALLRNLLEKRPDLADATLLYSQIFNQLGQNDKAEAYLKKAVTNHPYSPYLRHIYGCTLLFAGKNQEAAKAFKSALQLAPTMKESYLQLFNIYEKNSTELEKILLEAISKIKYFEQAVIRLASLYNANGQTGKAITLYQEALARSPSSSTLANNLACLYLDHVPDKINEAMRLAKLAYEKDSNNAAYADTLGWTYYIKGNLVRAKWLIHEANNREPTNEAISHHLELVHLAINKSTRSDPSFPTSDHHY